MKRPTYLVLVYGLETNGKMYYKFIYFQYNTISRN